MLGNILRSDSCTIHFLNTHIYIEMWYLVGPGKHHLGIWYFFHIDSMDVEDEYGGLANLIVFQLFYRDVHLSSIN